MKDIAMMRLLLTCTFLGAYAVSASAQNLLPNGSFDASAKINGWTIPAGTGSITYDATHDSQLRPQSGSLKLQGISTVPIVTSVANSACFQVVPNAAFQYGADFAGLDGGYTRDQLASNTSFYCSSYVDVNCSVGQTPLGSIQAIEFSPIVQDVVFTPYPTVNGTLPSYAKSANCSVNVTSLPFNGSPSAGASSLELDNAYFDSAAPPVTLGGYMSGNWYDPSNPGDGFQLEFTSQQNALVGAWFTFAADGSGGPIWIFLQGTYDPAGNTVSIPAFLDHGGAFRPAFNSSNVLVKPWGSVTFAFTDCNHGTASWTPTIAGYSAGSMPIARLTTIAGTTCQ